MSHDHDHETPLGPALRAEALEALLLEKGTFGSCGGRCGDRQLRGAGGALEWRSSGGSCVDRRGLSSAAPGRWHGCRGGTGHRRWPRGADGAARGGGERPCGSQRRGMHAVLVLPLGALGLAAALVQGSGLSVASGSRASCGPSSSVWKCRRRRPCRSGIPRLKCATSSCRSARKARKASPRPSWRPSCPGKP